MKREVPPILDQKKASDHTYKAWITPVGQLVPTKGGWHYSWIIGNDPYVHELAKSDKEGPIRIIALQKGYVRINMGARGNTGLTIELDAKYLSKQKDAIWELVHSVIDEVGFVHITLLDTQDEDNVKVVKKATANTIVNLNAPRKSAREKMEDIPFINEAVEEDEKPITEYKKFDETLNRFK